MPRQKSGGPATFASFEGALQDALKEADADTSLIDLDEATRTAQAEVDGRNEHPQAEDLRKEQLIGGGGFSSVWRVTDVRSNGTYALKQMRKGFTIKKQATERVMLEKEAHQDMRHPFIVKLYATFQDESSFYFLLSLAAGGDLFGLMDDNPTLPEDWVRFYGAGIALALRHMHTMGFVYRDLKPENVLLDQYGYAMLADLGFAKRADHSRTFTNVGTDQYLPPELLHGRGRTHAADWWALGVLLFELLLGAPPFGGDDQRAVLTNIHLYADGGVEANQRLRALLEQRVSREGADLVASMVDTNEATRIGCGAGGFRPILQHPWFKPLNWHKLVKRELPPPHVPPKDMKSAFDVDPAVMQDVPWEEALWQPKFRAFGPTVVVSKNVDGAAPA